MANLDELAMLAAVEVVEEAEVAIDEGRRRFRPHIDGFEQLSDAKFIKMFRLSKELAGIVINEIEQFVPPPVRLSALSVERKVLTALRFFATGSYQLDIGSNIFTSISQPSVSRCIADVADALNQPQIFNRWVKFPQNLQELAINRDRFYTKFGFPGVIGCIDCTHVAIIAPQRQNGNDREHVYVNRKSYHSINVQLICDSNMKIININALYPGSTNDAFIWNNSNIRQLMEQLHNNDHKAFHLLGDSGYPLRPWLLTPLEIEPLPNTPEAVYNSFHKTTRCLIERCNGLLKMRFRCLLKHRVLHYSPEVACKIINACAVLHNMCVEYNVPDPEGEDEDDALDFGRIVNERVAGEEDVLGRRVNPLLAEARRLQTRIIHNYFSRE